VIDLSILDQEGFFSNLFLPEGIFLKDSLNDLIGLGKVKTKKIRERVQQLLLQENEELRTHSIRGKVLIKSKEVVMLLPVKIGDYTDFYSSIEHATNVGKMFRDPENALLPNWRHLPVGYHGRASSIVVSGTPIHRPKGQFKDANMDKPAFGPSRSMDFELELAFITGKTTQLGEFIATQDAEDYIFGMVLFNDWSARDMQSWEYVPLGPFLAKSFASTMSAWVVSMDALEPFRVEGPDQDPTPLPYLQFTGNHNYDIELEVLIESPRFNPARIVHSNYKYMYWNMVQQLTHHASNGCNIQVGDLYASGTISGPIRDSFGSMLELTWRGTEPLKMPDNTERKFINDHDIVYMRAFAQNNDVRIGFGEISTKILPAS
jgi:fumarylacetoacetase